jgi:hypothetical protein
MKNQEPIEWATDLILQLVLSVPQSIAGGFWFIVTTIWNAYWPFIVVGLVLWTLWELVTKNGGFHYNSENGFSPTYNRFVGSGMYLLFQWLTYELLTKLFGNEIYAYAWPYGVHIAAFLSVGLFLNLVGFWKYWKIPNF